MGHARTKIGKGLLEQGSYALTSGSMLFRQGIESAVKLGFDFLSIYLHSAQDVFRFGGIDRVRRAQNAGRQKRDASRSCVERIDFVLVRHGWTSLTKWCSMKRRRSRFLRF